MAFSGDDRAAPTVEAPAQLNEHTIVLKQLPGEGAAPKFGGTELYDGCSLLTVEELGQLGMRLHPRAEVEHGYLDGDVPAAPARMATTSSCVYYLSNQSRVSVDVYQTPRNTPGMLTERLVASAKDAAVRDEHGLKIAVWQDEDFQYWRFHVARSGLLVEGEIWTKAVPAEGFRARTDQFGEFTAEEFTNEVSSFIAGKVNEGPTAPARHVYDAPFQGTKPVCEVASAAAGTGSAVMITATYKAGADETSIGKPGEKAFRTATSCDRSDLQGHRQLKVALDLWDEPAGATFSNSALCDPANAYLTNPPPIRIDPSFGTGQTCLFNAFSANWDLVFQVDEVGVHMSTGWFDDPTTPEERRAQLIPVAPAVVQALR
jgi:hypothetical protein